MINYSVAKYFPLVIMIWGKEVRSSLMYLSECTVSGGEKKEERSNNFCCSDSTPYTNSEHHVNIPYVTLQGAPV
jgi:hypothetical protein